MRAPLILRCLIATISLSSITLLPQSNLKLLPVAPDRIGADHDWLIHSETFVARAYRNQAGDELILSNGLVERRFRLDQATVATVALNQLTQGRSLLRAFTPEARIGINGNSYAIGGLQGQPNRAYLAPEWIDQAEPIPSPFVFKGFDIGDPTPKIKWKRARHHAPDAIWPPKGIRLNLIFETLGDVELPKLRIRICYEFYDGIPAYAKWFTLENLSDSSITINTFASELLAAVEYGSTVEDRKYSVPEPNIHVETDYAFASMEARDANHHVVRWLPDPEYDSQVSYRKLTPCLLEVGPEYGPAQPLEPGESFTTFRAYVMAPDSTDRERKGLTIRRFYKTIAPWTTENPLMMHARFADETRVKAAIDQAAEVGFEMVILTFGSGFNIEDDSPEYIAKMKDYADYARAKGVEIGGYSLLASRSVSPEADVVMPEGMTPRFGNSPCICSQWGENYFNKLYHFYKTTGFSLLEHDGSYPGDICASTNHPGHTGLADSRWNQYQVISEFYQWCRAEGVYLNIPDYYYLTGGSKCGMGYREVNWSRPRAEQVIHTRQNIYDGTWTKSNTMGWMFVPLTEYHGGGAAATIEPLSEHLDHYQLMMMSNLTAGVQACYRGPRLYDTDATRAMVTETVAWYKQHREVLEGDLIHLRRPDGQNLDYWLMVNPTSKEKGAFVVFNPTDRHISQTINAPLYYTGISDQTRITSQYLETETRTLNRDYSVDLLVKVAPHKWSVIFFQDAE